ncbi:MAG: protein kinase [Proteobacteria bacterium]|nr:protein kinase [Pseudomonadota bacterium]
MDRDESAPTIEEYAVPQTVLEGHIVGRTLGDFSVKELIGSGGFGAVYRAEQVKLSREVVIKVLQWDADGNETDRVRRFLREARLASRLDHPYAAHIYAFGVETDGILWLAMEFVRGTPLSELLELQGPLSLGRLIPLLEKICEVIHTAHQEGIVHRDIKPANVMVLARAGRLLPKLLDFGIARLADDLKDEGRTAANKVGKGAKTAKPDDDPRANWSMSNLTRRGLYLGSPPYMAPEQWVNAANVDARTDQYGVAVLAYQALTGRLPFRASSDSAMARAHASKQVPPLGDGFPAGLNEVLRRALAKKPADRFRDVLAFANAFRAAAGFDVEPDHLPQLDPFARETAIAQAPQPLADAVALLEAARSPQRALDAAFQIIRVAVRLVGLLAIAGFTRVGAGGDGEVRTARDCLARLRRHSFSPKDWLELTRVLLGPFAAKPDAYPVPELVLLLFTPRGDTPSNELFDELAALEERGATELEDDESGRQALDALAQLVPKVAGLLKALSFLCDYPVIVGRGGRTERWMGARRSSRIVVTLPEEAAPGDDKVVLTDRSGEFVLSLSPLIQLLAPAPGAPDELFLFDGPGRYGAKLVAFPVGFERHDSEFWPWYKEHLVGLDQAKKDRADTADDGSDAPYKGLSTFSPRDAANFFGREREAEACVNRLRVQSMLAVVGPSGAGKSSFVQAGVIPALPDNWRAITTRPGPKPLAQLQGRMEREGLDVGDLRKNLEQDIGALGDALRKLAGKDTLLLVIDQFEELLTLCLDADERALYAAGLMRAVGPGDDPVRLVITLRDDFLLRAQQLAPLRERLGQSLQLLGTPPPDDLERILVEPARRAGYEFEDPDLPTEMVTAVAGESGALALLSFTASKLWDMRDRHFHRLSRRAYEALGGVGGALAQHAEATLADMAEEQQAMVREVFRQLVTADGTRAILTRRELKQMLGGSEQSDTVLEELIKARLLVASEGESGDDRVEVVHEALLSSWPRLVRWQREDAESARLRDQLRAAARQWVERKRPRGLLWRGDALLEYRVWYSRYRGSLTDDEQGFARASMREEARGRQHKRLVLITAFLVLATGLVILSQLHRRAGQERDRAEAFATESERRLLDLYVEQGRQALLSGDPMRAFVYLAEARRGGAAGHIPGFLLARATEALAGQLRVLAGHDGAVLSVQFSPDGSLVTTAGHDGKVVLWDAGDGTVRSTLEGHSEPVWMARFNPDGSRLASAGWDGKVILWDTATGQMQWSGKHDDKVMWIGFTGDGTKLATASTDKTAKIWDAGSGQLLTTLEGHTARLTSAALSPTGQHLVTGSFDQTARIWDIEASSYVAAVAGHGGLIPAIDISDDGSRVATASWGRKALLFSILGGAPIPLAEHDAQVTWASFDPGGTHLVTASEDRTAKVWNAHTGKLVLSLEGHTGGIIFAGYSPDGSRILTASRDSTVRMWDARTGLPLWTYIGHRDALWTGHFDRTGTRVVTASFDGTARIWNARQTFHTLASKPRGSVVLGAAHSPDHQQIATVHDDGTVRVWDRQGNELAAVQEGRTDGNLATAETKYKRASVSWSSDGTRLVAAGGAAAVVWDITEARPVHKLGGQGLSIRHAIYDRAGVRIITSGSDRTARLWDARTGALLYTLDGHQAAVTSADFHPEGRLLATASVDKTIRMWDAASGQSLLTLTEHTLQVNSVRFSHSGRYLVTAAEDKTAKVWTTSGGLVTSLEEHTDAVTHAVFSPDEILIATASQDGTVKVWDVVSGRLLWSIELYLTPAWSVEFNQDGRSLLIAHGQTASIWNVSYDDRSTDQIAAFAACRVTYVLDEGQLKRVKTDRSACERRTERQSGPSLR